MNHLSSLLASLSAACLLGFAATPTLAQIVQPRPSTVRDAAPLPPVNLKLNARQQSAIAQFGEVAFDQLEHMLNSGFDPDKLSRPETAEATRRMVRQLPDALRPDAQQLGDIRALLRAAREQLSQQLNPARPVAP